MGINERERDRQTDRETERQRQRDRDRQRLRQTDRETERERGRGGGIYVLKFNSPSVSTVKGHLKVKQRRGGVVTEKGSFAGLPVLLMEQEEPCCLDHSSVHGTGGTLLFGSQFCS